MLPSPSVREGFLLAQLGSLKVAIVHDWLTSPGGAERVLEQMIEVFPSADLFTVCDFLPERHRHLLHHKQTQTTFIQRLPFASKLYRSYLPLMAFAIEQLDLSAYDLILSSSYAVAKGVITGPDQLHISYVHTPLRYAWHLQAQYLKEGNLDRGLKSWIARLSLHYLRMWDVRSAAGVDVFVANSHYVAAQVNRLYRRDCKVLYPPVDVESLTFRGDKEDFFMTASRLVPYKRVDLIVRAFAQMPDRRLVVVGDGPDRARVEEAAKGHANIELLGYQSDAELHSLMGRARAFVFAAMEDFGITPVEAQACGTPVIAYGKGGALESIRGESSAFDETGTFFLEQTEESIIAAVQQFEAVAPRITPENCRQNAARFSKTEFRKGLVSIASAGVDARAREETYPSILDQRSSLSAVAPKDIKHESVRRPA